ncbi:protein of unknown function [Methylacidimicrobium sp. AP8]|nr:protein of unknown function [Methylacidimicrobium sp. AP8]
MACLCRYEMTLVPACDPPDSPDASVDPVRKQLLFFEHTVTHLDFDHRILRLLRLGCRDP